MKKLNFWKIKSLIDLKKKTKKKKTIFPLSPLKSPYICLRSFEKRYFENFIFLIYRIIELVTREACIFPTRQPIFNQN